MFIVDIREEGGIDVKVWVLCIYKEALRELEIVIMKNFIFNGWD